MLELIRQRFEEIDDEDLDCEEVEKLYSGGKRPKYGSITSEEEMYIALYQKRKCGVCSKCYWEYSNGGGCGAENLVEEILRVMQITEKTKPQQCTCAECVYASQTKPRICMNPNSIAKHSYVSDDSYCDKGEPICVI